MDGRSRGIVPLIAAQEKVKDRGQCHSVNFCYVKGSWMDMKLQPPIMCNFAFCEFL